jgi:hypothetical protein
VPEIYFKGKVFAVDSTNKYHEKGGMRRKTMYLRHIAMWRAVYVKLLQLNDMMKSG